MAKQNPPYSNLTDWLERNDEDTDWSEVNLQNEVNRIMKDKASDADSARQLKGSAWSRFEADQKTRFDDLALADQTEGKSFKELKDISNTHSKTLIRNKAKDKWMGMKGEIKAKIDNISNLSTEQEVENYQIDEDEVSAVGLTRSLRVAKEKKIKQFQEAATEIIKINESKRDAINYLEGLDEPTKASVSVFEARARDAIGSRAGDLVRALRSGETTREDIINEINNA